MMKNLIILSYSLAAILFFSNFTNNTTLLTKETTISGKVVTQNGEQLIGASILLKGTALGTVTDIDGQYSFKIPAASKTTLVCSYTGFADIEKTIEIHGKQAAICDFQMVAGVSLDEVVVVGHEIPLIKKDNSTQGQALTAEQIRNLPTRNVNALAGIASNQKVKRSKRKEGKKLNIRGSRGNATNYYLDGIRITGRTNATSKEAYPKNYAPPINSLPAGSLTAGEVHDFSKWDLWNDLSAEDLHEWATRWNFNLTQRYTIQVGTNEGYPLIDAVVELKQKNETIWIARTDNTGKAELWAQVFNPETDSQSDLSATITYRNKNKTIERLTPFQEGVNIVSLDASCETPQNLDILFVIDATGSMGDEIRYLQTEIYDVINRVQNLGTNMNLRLGSLFYRDLNDAYVTKYQDLTSDIPKTINFIKAQNATGGNPDYEEAVEIALDEAIHQVSWSKNAVAKLLFLVLDAPPRNNPEVLAKLEIITQKAAQKGIRIIPIVCSDSDKSNEYLMRSLALATNGTYLFLTNDSGIGNAHIEPSTDEYKVETLNDLMVRVIQQFTTVNSCTNKDQFIEEWNNVYVKAQKKEKNDIKVFPNPTSGTFTIKLKKPVAELFITDLSGKNLARLTKIAAGNTRFDLGAYPSGIYFVRYMAGEKIVSERIVLQRGVSLAGK